MLRAIRGLTAVRGLRAACTMVASCALLAACGPAEDEGASPPEGPVPEGTPLEISEQPRLSVGVVEGDTLRQFHGVVTPFLLPNGTLAVPLSDAAVIRLFGPDGDFIQTLGRPGEGPGEFSSLSAAWPRGDTIEAFDNQLRRITRFLPDGTVEVVSLEPAGAAQGAVPRGLPEGWVLFGVESAGLGRRDEVAVHGFYRDGSHLGEIARVEGMRRLRTPAITGPDPLSPKWVIAARGGRVYVAETLTPTLRVLDLEGQLRREISWEPGRSMTPEEAFGAVVSAAARRAGPDEAAETRRRLRAFPVPDRVSAFWDVTVDAEGFLWVRPFDPTQHSPALGGFRGAGEGGRWLILSSSGMRVGSVKVPDGLEPTHMARDAVVGIRRDELGVESVSVHSLERQ